MIAMAHLPNELYRHIVEDVSSTNELFNLLLTSRAFNAEAERVLYSSLVIDTRPSPNKQSSAIERHATSLLKHLVACPRVARRVRSLVIRAWLPEVADLTASALRSLPDLQKLALYPHYSRVFYTGYATMESGYLLQGCTFRLRELTYRGGIDHPFLEFLNTQTTLVDLMWEDYNDGPSIPSSILPNLATLRGSGDLLQRLLPGRGIKRFKWEEVTFFKSLSLFSSLREELQCLSISQGGWPLQIQLPNLYFLEITLSTIQHTALLSWLRLLPSLEIVAINCPDHLHITFSDMAGMLFKNSSSLKYIEIYVPSDPETLVVWERGAKVADVIQSPKMSEGRKDRWKTVRRWC